MKPLLEIHTVPISIEFKTTPAQLTRTSATADLEISRERNGLQIKSRPIKLNIDTFESRSSYMPTVKQSIDQMAEKSINIAYQATARFAQEGNMLLDITTGADPLGDIIRSRSMGQSKDFTIGFVPNAPANISWTPGDMQIRYEMDKLNFDWKTNQGDFEFTPASIEFNIKQYPKVVIDYVGDPIYVPPSANPNYVPIDEKA